MSDQTQATLSTQSELETDATLCAADREILRGLACRVAELAARWPRCSRTAISIL